MAIGYFAYRGNVHHKTQGIVKTPFCHCNLRILSITANLAFPIPYNSFSLTFIYSHHLLLIMVNTKLFLHIVTAFLIGTVLVLILLLRIISYCTTRFTIPPNLIIQSQDLEQGLPLRNLHLADQGGVHVPMQILHQQQQQEGLKELSEPPFEYKSHETIANHCSDCAICLEDFKDGDLCRVLSKCNHMYHKGCIDQWLIKDNHCPFCRSSIGGAHSN